MKLLNYSCDLRSAKFNVEVLSEKFEKTLLVRFPPANSGNTSKTEFKAQFSEKLALEEKVQQKTETLSNLSIISQRNPPFQGGSNGMQHSTVKTVIAGNAGWIFFEERIEKLEPISFSSNHL